MVNACLPRAASLGPPWMYQQCALSSAPMRRSPIRFFIVLWLPLPLCFPWDFQETPRFITLIPFVCEATFNLAFPSHPYGMGHCMSTHVEIALGTFSFPLCVVSFSALEPSRTVIFFFIKEHLALISASSPTGDPEWLVTLLVLRAIM